MGYKKDTARAIGGGTLLILIIGLVALIIGAVFWGITVASSGVKGQGDGIIQKNSSANWIEKQQQFERLYEGIQTQDRRVNNAAEELAKNPTDKTLQQTYSGVKSACEGLVGDYNTLSNEFLAADFKDSRLPYKIDQSLSNFDCKENK